jgi:hypothetical protein
MAESISKRQRLSASLHRKLLRIDKGLACKDKLESLSA